MMSPCPVCRQPLAFVQQYNAWWCNHCRQYRQPAPQGGPAPAPPQAPPAQAAPATGGLWFQNFYRLRKKVFAIAAQYWIEDANGAQLGYSKQKLLVLKEDVRVFSDERMAHELFRIQQQQIIDVWGTFAVVDSASNTLLGYIRRKGLESIFIRDEWEILDPWNRLVGGIYESSTGRALARKYLPGGGLIPEQMTLTLQGAPVATINQQFKLIGDIWEINCQTLPPAFDRRVLLGCALLMSIVERRHK